MLQPAAHFEPVDVGEADIEQDEIRRLAVDRFERREPRAGRAHDVALCLEHLREQGQVRLLVVDGEYVAPYRPALVHVVEGESTGRAGSGG